MQFFYKRKEIINVTEERPAGEEITLTDSFNTECVTRTSEDANGNRLIILNDGHMESRYDNYPVVKAGKIVSYEFRKEAAYYQSEIMLNKEDSERYYSIGQTIFTD